MYRKEDALPAGLDKVCAAFDDAETKAGCDEAVSSVKGQMEGKSGKEKFSDAQKEAAAKFCKALSRAHFP